jgi:alpha-tubulin suppressor-like RCC1 family protein
VVNGGVQCWGYNYSGQLGNNLSPTSLTPVRVLALTSAGATAVADGDNHTCAVVNGGVQCWGYNYYGQLGNNSTANSPTPVQVLGLISGATAVAGGGTQSCALVNGSAYCWGYNYYGQLGNNSTTDSYTPVQVQLP